MHVYVTAEGVAAGSEEVDRKFGSRPDRFLGGAKVLFGTVVLLSVIDMGYLKIIADFPHVLVSKCCYFYGVSALLSLIPLL